MGAGPKCGTFDKVNKEGRASGGMDQITIGSLPEGKTLGDMFFQKIFLVSFEFVLLAKNEWRNWILSQKGMHEFALLTRKE